MNIICPKCGKDDTVPFSDSVYKTTGFECHNCKKDFGVDDGHVTQSHEDKLCFFLFNYQKEDGSIFNIKIEKIKTGKVLLTPTITLPDKRIQPYEPIDFTDSFMALVKTLFEKTFILDWPKNKVGDLKESYKIEMKYTNEYPDTTFEGKGYLPPYFKALDYIFETLLIN